MVLFSFLTSLTVLLQWFSVQGDLPLSHLPRTGTSGSVCRQILGWLSQLRNTTGVQWAEAIVGFRSTSYMVQNASNNKELPGLKFKWCWSNDRNFCPPCSREVWCAGIFLCEWDSNVKMRQGWPAICILSLTRLGFVAKIVLASASPKEHDLPSPQGAGNSSISF